MGGPKAGPPREQAKATPQRAQASGNLLKKLGLDGRGPTRSPPRGLQPGSRDSGHTRVATWPALPLAGPLCPGCQGRHPFNLVNKPLSRYIYFDFYAQMKERLNHLLKVMQLLSRAGVRVLPTLLQVPGFPHCRIFNSVCWRDRPVF